MRPPSPRQDADRSPSPGRRIASVFPLSRARRTCIFYALILSLVAFWVAVDIPTKPPSPFRMALLWSLRGGNNSDESSTVTAPLPMTKEQDNKKEHVVDVPVVTRLSAPASQEDMKDQERAEEVMINGSEEEGQEEAQRPPQQDVLHLNDEKDDEQEQVEEVMLNNGAAEKEEGRQEEEAQHDHPGVPDAEENKAAAAEEDDEDDVEAEQDQHANPPADSDDDDKEQQQGEQEGVHEKDDDDNEGEDAEGNHHDEVSEKERHLEEEAQEPEKVEDESNEQEEEEPIQRDEAVEPGQEEREGHDNSNNDSEVKESDQKEEGEEETSKTGNLRSNGSSSRESALTSSSHNEDDHKESISSSAKSSKTSNYYKKSSKKIPIRPDTLWQNKHDVVHILTTRYMQLQPDLIHLGQARNDLFKTFTMPSLAAQTNQEFLWLIFTDPALHPDILDDFVDMIRPYPNILLLGINAGIVDLNFRDKKWIGKIQKVFSGDVQRLKDYWVASQWRPLLETRLDADDSIFVNLIESVQKRAAVTLGARARLHHYDVTQMKKEFRIFCTEHHLEWGYFNPWEKSSQKGHLFGRFEPELCISAGLTYGYQVGTKPKHLPTKSHHKLAKVIPACDTVTPKDGNDEAAKKVVYDNKSRNCIERIDAQHYKYILLRSRTPTSAGMLGVIPNQKVVHSTTWRKKQDWAWETMIEKNFAVPPQSIFDLRERLKNNMKNILTDALNGQCTKAEFTCKDETKVALHRLLAAVKENSE